MEKIITDEIAFDVDKHSVNYKVAVLMDIVDSFEKSIILNELRDFEKEEIFKAVFYASLQLQKYDKKFAMRISNEMPKQGKK